MGKLTVGSNPTASANVMSSDIVGGSSCSAVCQATARRKTLVAQASTSTHSGTRTANACHTAAVAMCPTASARPATTR